MSDRPDPKRTAERPAALGALQQRARSLAERLRFRYASARVAYAGCEADVVLAALRAAGLDASRLELGALDTTGAPIEGAPAPSDALFDLVVCSLDTADRDAQAVDTLITVLTAWARSVLLALVPLHNPAAAPPRVQPEVWARAFAQRGFFRDFETDPTFVQGGFRLFSRQPLDTVVAGYEAYLEAQALAVSGQRAHVERQRVLELLLGKRERQLASLLEAAANRGAGSAGRGKLQPQADPLSRLSRMVQRGVRLARRTGPAAWGVPGAAGRVSATPGASAPAAIVPLSLPARQLAPPAPRPGVKPLRSQVWVLLLIDGALDGDASARLDASVSALMRFTHPLCPLLLACPAAAPHTVAHVRQIAASLGLHTEQDAGSMRLWLPADVASATQPPDAVIALRHGLRHSPIVTPGWVERLVACATSDQQIGLVTPLTVGREVAARLTVDGASGNPATLDPLADAAQIAEGLAQLGEQYAGRVYPRIPTADSACLLIGRAALPDWTGAPVVWIGALLGALDSLPAQVQAVGQQIALADDVCIFQPDAPDLLAHPLAAGQAPQAGSAAPSVSRQTVIVVEGARSSLLAGLARDRWIATGRQRFEGRRLLLALPLSVSRAAAYALLQQIPALRAMGVDARIVSPVDEETTLREEFPHELPFLSASLDLQPAAQFERLFQAYDAIVASFALTNGAAAPIESAARPRYEAITERIQATGAAVSTLTLAQPLALGGAAPARLWVAQAHPATQSGGPPSTPISWSVDLDLFRPRRRHSQASDTPHADQAPRIGIIARHEHEGRGRASVEALIQQVAAASGGPVQLLRLMTTPDRGRREDRLQIEGQSGNGLGRLQRAALLPALDVLIDSGPEADDGVLVSEALAAGALVVTPSALSEAAALPQAGLIALEMHGDSTKAARALLAALRDHTATHAALAQAAERPPERAAFELLTAIFGGQP